MLTTKIQTYLCKPYKKPYIKASQVFDLDIKQHTARCKISQLLTQVEGECDKTITYSDELLVTLTLHFSSVTCKN